MPRSDRDPASDTVRPIAEHLTELRRRIIASVVVLLVACGVAFAFYEPIHALLTRPFVQLASAVPTDRLFVGTIMEGFMTRVRVALLSGVVLSAPFHVANALRFVFPGLTRKEKRVVTVAVVTSFFVLVASAYYGYAFIVPVSIGFLTSERMLPADVGLILNYRQNITYVFQFILGTLVVFQTPILLEILMVLGLVSRRALVRAGRFVVVGTFVLAAVVTPPDIVSQVALAIPLVVLYYLSIGIARLFRFGES